MNLLSKAIKKSLRIYNRVEFVEKNIILKSFLTGEIASLEAIQKAESVIKSWDGSLGEDPFPLFHTICDGVYSREMHVPKGYLIVGKMHRYEHLVHVNMGKIMVADETGVREITAPYTFVSKPGIKRIGITLEDTVWTDIHKTSKTSLPEIEQEIFMREDAQEANDVINTEYEKVVSDLGLTKEKIRSITENTEDMIFDEQDGIELRPSKIEGVGIFATKDYNYCEIIGDARVERKRTLIGRYTNHSDTPNANSVVSGQKIQFVALKHISKGSEITVDYRNTVQSAKELDLITGENQCQAL